MTTIDEPNAAGAVALEVAVEGPTESFVAGRAAPVRRRVVWRLAGLMAAGGVVVGVGGHAWLDARHDLQELDARLAEADARLPELSGTLASDRSNLDSARSRLAAARRELAKRTAERDRSQAALEEAERNLAHDRGQLDRRTVELGQRQQSSALLETCLVGASEALNSVSVGDLGSFARTIREIGDTCAAAGEQL